jgi:undecaprenyl diphosphate synthase
LRRVTRFCRQVGLRELTFFALSTENFERRPPAEIRFLMKLLRRFVVGERPELMENDIRFTVIGNVEALPAAVRADIATTIRLTQSCKTMVLRLALNYGARQEIVAAARALCREALDGGLSRLDVERLDEAAFRRYLADPTMSDPDLIIRTAGEFRLSNFLLWQSSYSEWWISPRLWPDFELIDLQAALRAYARRERRFGGVGESTRGAGGAAATAPGAPPER